MGRECGSERGAGSSRPWALVGVLAGGSGGQGHLPNPSPARTMALLSYRHLSGCGGPFPTRVTRRPTCYTVEETKGKPWRAEQLPTLCLGPARPQELEPPITPQLLPAMGLLRLKPVTCRRNPQNVLAGEWLLAGCACHGRERCFAQAGPAQEVTTGKLVRRLPFGSRVRTLFCRMCIQGPGCSQTALVNQGGKQTRVRESGPVQTPSGRQGMCLE